MSRTVKSSKGSPLAGLRVLVGRARHQASALSTGLEKLGAEVIEIPFIEIRKPLSYKPLDAALKHIAEYDWLVLTSVNGVEAFSIRMKHLRMDGSRLRRLQIAAIGPSTTSAIENLGLKVAVVPERYIAESVVESLKARVKGKRVLLARAKVARDVIPRELRKAGATVDVIEAYETVIPKSSKTRLRALMKHPRLRPDVITFTSSSTVRNFAELLDLSRAQEHVRARVEGIHFASIGPVTSATLREFGLDADIEAREYTIPGLIQAIASRTASEKSRNMSRRPSGPAPPSRNARRVGKASW
jgi:uroporphyrinogen-III synthase